ncbi:MADF domain [Cinara cedri]|uniref:MADF domain n=1 Tax=Cinara cedri TaxID=506608 RepID=A0A5E4NSX7_9HEMI|nr:MADF domain [Cinara cedri]
MALLRPMWYYGIQLWGSAKPSNTRTIQALQSICLRLISEQNCRNRWKNIHTAFGRSRRPPKSRSGGRSKKPYYLATYLGFLCPYMQGASTSGNVPPEEESDNDTYPTNMQATDTQDEEGNSQDIPGVTPNNKAFLDSETEIYPKPTPRKKKK